MYTNEIEDLAREQSRDDSSVQFPQHGMASLDAPYDDEEGAATLGDSIGVDSAGKWYITPPRKYKGGIYELPYCVLRGEEALAFCRDLERNFSAWCSWHRINRAVQGKRSNKARFYQASWVWNFARHGVPHWVLSVVTGLSEATISRDVSWRQDLSVYTPPTAKARTRPASIPDPPMGMLKLIRAQIHESGCPQRTWGEMALSDPVYKFRSGEVYELRPEHVRLAENQRFVAAWRQRSAAFSSSVADLGSASRGDGRDACPPSSAVGHDPEGDEEVTEVLAQLEAMRADIAIVREDSAETRRVVVDAAERIRLRFPSDAEISSAVEELIAVATS